MRIAFIGAGRLVQALAPAFHQAGFNVVAIAARSPERAGVFSQSIGDCQVCATAQQAADMADLVFIAVTDAAIAGVASQIAWQPGQSVVHCSGATEVSVLSVAAAQGAVIGGFHPLQLFADPSVALRCMAGSSVAIEAEGALEVTLKQMAQAVGYRAIKLPAGARGRYHCATNYGASFLLSLLREACDLWNSFGVSDQDALAALLPLAHGTLETAQAKGLAGAIAGPISRGDADVVTLHMRALSEVDASRLELYREVSVRQLRLAKEQGRLDEDALVRLEAAILAGR